MLRKFSVDVSRKKGTLVVNPGGPGGSGTDWVLAAGRALQVASGDQYDVLGFDPRCAEHHYLLEEKILSLEGLTTPTSSLSGVLLTSPSISTHASGSERAVFDYRYPTFPLYDSPSSFVNDSNPLFVEEQLRRMKALGTRSDLVVDLLRTRNTEEELRSLSTAFVARDL